MLKEFKEKEFNQYGAIFGPNWLIIQPNKKEQQLESDKSLYHIKERKCKLCNTLFDYGKSIKTICNCCKIFSICKICNQIMEVKLENYSGTKRKLLIDNIINKKEIEVTHRYGCYNLNRYSFGKYSNHKYENVNIYNSRCICRSNKRIK